MRISALIKRLTFIASLCALTGSVCIVAAQQQTAASPTSDAAKPQTGGEKPAATQEELLTEVRHLTAAVDKLRKRVAELEKDRRADLIQERLTKAEQRGEELQKQLRELTEKDGSLQLHLDQVNESLRPENIERAVGPVGTLHPEEARQALTRRLNNEKHQIQNQRDALAQSHSRLQASLATADAEVQRLRGRLQSELHP